MFFTHREQVVSFLARMVVIIWLFVVLIITSSYTASLTSILTVQQLSPTIKGIDDLISSNGPIGYLSGSFVKKYLSEELNIAQSRLKPFESPESYAHALMDGPSRGGVAAVIDELPAIKILLANHCGFKIAGQPFTKTSWGFVFQNGSPLVIDMSTAILNLSESGELQRIHDKWLGVSRCKSQSEQEGPNQLGLKNFWGLFLIIGVTSFSAFLAFLCYSVIQFRKRSNTSDDSQSRSVLIRFLHFVFLEGQKCKEEETKSKCERECTSSHHASR